MAAARCYDLRREIFIGRAGIRHSGRGKNNKRGNCRRCDHRANGFEHLCPASEPF